MRASHLLNLRAGRPAGSPGPLRRALLARSPLARTSLARTPLARTPRGASRRAARGTLGATLALALGLAGLGSGTVPAASAPLATSPAATSPAATAAVATAAKVASSGTVTWGFKDSWRSYVVKQVFSPDPLPAGQQIVVGRPATFAARGTAAVATNPETRAYRFPVTAASGGSTKNLRLTTSGHVRFRVGGHFDIRFTNVKVVVKNRTARVVADVRVDAQAAFGSIDAGRTTRRNVTIATAPASTTRITATRGKVTVRTNGLTLTRAGSAALGGMYPTGTELDALTATTTSKAKVRQTLATTVRSTARPKVAVRVTSSGLTPAGRVTVTATTGKRTVTRTATLSKGRATVTLPRLAKGTWKVRTKYRGTTTVAAKTSTTAKLQVR